MATPSTFPSDGRITSLQNYSAALVGTELLQLVAPGNAAAGVNYNVTVTQMLSGLLPALPPQSANVVLAGPTSGAGTATPTFRNLVLADIPGGTSGFPLVGNNATSAPSYQLLTVPGGGTGTSTLTQNGILYGNGASVVGITNAPATGQILAANNGTAVWSAAAAIATSLQVPLIIGGVNANSTLILESTSGAGSTDAIIFNTGSQTQAMRIVSGGEVLVGPQTVGYAQALLDVSYNTGTPAVPINSYDQIRISGANGVSPAFVADSFGSNAGVLAFRAASGTLQAPTPTAINQNFALLQFYGYDGSNYGVGAQILVQAAATFNATTHPGFIAFDTTPGGTTTITEAMRIQASGGLSIGTATDLGKGQLIVNTAIMSPLHIGGMTATATLTLESTNAAGSGDAIIFNTGSQTQAMRITSAQEVLIGPQTTGYTAALLDIQYNTGTPATPQANYQQMRITGANGSFAALAADSFGGGVYPNIITRAASGSLQTPTAIGAGQTIGSMLAYAYNGGTYGLCAQIAVNSVNQQSSTDSSALIAFNTVVPGTTTLTQAMQLRSGLSVGTSTDPGVGGIINAGTATIGGFLSATSVAAGTTTNPGTGAFIVTGTATVGGLLSVAGAANIIGTATITNYANASSLALGTTTNPGAGGLIITGTATIGGNISGNAIAVGTTTFLGGGTIAATGPAKILNNVALSSGGASTAGFTFFNVAQALGLFAGTGVPTLTAATSALYLRNDAVSSTTRAYINTNGGSTWVGLTATG